MVVAVTGASGFLGLGLARELASRSLVVRSLVRSLRTANEPFTVHTTNIAVGDINSYTDWLPALSGVDCVVHCASRAHVMHESEADALSAYRMVNVEGSRRLAEQAAALGVRRLVYVSSIKVNGNNTALGAPYSFLDKPEPEGVYGLSKLEAERALWEISAKTGLEVVVVRPPLIYGPGVKGNLARLLKLVRSGMPLPLGAVRNKRSLIGRDNLVDLLIRCIDHPAAAGETFLVCDGEDLSTSDLLGQMATAMGSSARLFPVPLSLLRFAGSVLGKLTEIDRLVGSLQVDGSHTRRMLDWNPTVSVKEGIRRMVHGS